MSLFSFRKNKKELTESDLKKLGSAGAAFTEKGLSGFEGSCVSYSVSTGLTTVNKHTSTLIDALARWTGDALTTAPLRHLDSKGNPVERSAIETLLENPLPEYGISYEQIIHKLAYDLKTQGNSFLVITRDRANDPVRLIPKNQLTPIIQEGVLVGWQDRGEIHQARDVIHFAVGLEGCLGRVPESMDMHIRMDREVDAYTRDILTNSNTMGLLITVPGNPTKANMEQMKETLNNSFGPGNRGGTAIFPEDSKVHFIGNNPADLDISSMTDRMEERISAIWGVPGTIIGLNQKDAKYSNIEQARKQALEGCLYPLWTNISKTLSKALLPEDETLEFDVTQSPLYEVVVKEKAQSAVLLWQSGLMKRSEARKMVGLNSVPEDEIYIESPVSIGNIAQAPEPKGGQ